MRTENEIYELILKTAKDDEKTALDKRSQIMSGQGR